MSSADIPREDNLKGSEGIGISKEIVSRKIADRNRNKNLTDQSREKRKDQRSKRSDHGQETENTRRNIARVIKTKEAVRTTRKNIKDDLIPRIPIEKTRGHLHLRSKNPRSKKTLSLNINHNLLLSLKTSTKSSKSTKEGICRHLRREMKVLLSQAQLCHHQMGSRMMMEILRQFEEYQIGKSDDFAGIGFYFKHFLIFITH